MILAQDTARESLGIQKTAMFPEFRNLGGNHF